MVTTRTDYTAEAIAAARSVLLELSHLLGEYRHDIAIIGGWVPPLLLPQAAAIYVGSMDVDLALNHRTLPVSGYRTIHQLLSERGYWQGEQPFIYHRRVLLGNREHVVEVDFLAGEYEGTGRRHRTQAVQDVRARKTRGCDLAFDTVSQVTIQGTLPNGGEDSAVVQVSSMPPFIVMKGMALYERLKEKDAWDIYFCLCHYPDGLDALIDKFLPYLEYGLVREGLVKIGEKFASPAHVGPQFVADFDEVDDPEDRALRQRDAYERVNYLIERLGIRPTPNR